MKKLRDIQNIQSQSELEYAFELKIGDNNPALMFPGAVMQSARYLASQVIKRNASLSGEGSVVDGAGASSSFPAVLSMVAALRGEGVTLLSWALCAALASEFTTSVCYVDLNWWWPSLPMADGQGIAGVLKKSLSLEKAIYKTSLGQLDAIPAGSLGRSERSTFARSNELKSLLADLSTRYQHLILDIPALRGNHDAPFLAGLADACCLVVRQGVTPVSDAQRALDEVDQIPMLGVVFNQVSYRSPAWLLNLFGAQ